MGFQVSKGGIQNCSDFWTKINMLKTNYCLLSIDIELRDQKLRITLIRNRVFKKNGSCQKMLLKNVLLLTLKVSFLHFLTTRQYVY